MVQLLDSDIRTREVLDWKGVHVLHFMGSSCSQKLRVFLNLKGIPWESHHVDLMANENFRPWFLGINPRGLVPVLVHDGAVHIESNDIVAYLDAHPRVAALGPRLVYPDGRRQDSAWRFPTPLVTVLGLLTVGKLGVKQSRGDSPRPVDWVMGAALVLRREALEQVGLFDEEFFLYSEEVDLQFRLRRAGWEVHYFPQATVVHHESQFSAEIPERRINEMWRSRHRYWHKHHRGAGARAAALATGAQYVARAAVAPLARRSARRMLLHARDSWRVTGPGLRELADEWNARVGAATRR